VVEGTSHGLADAVAASGFLEFIRYIIRAPAGLNRLNLLRMVDVFGNGGRE
jgi:hypothetical protein